jgi:thiol-disulfide isomerase/thioredoxin
MKAICLPARPVLEWTLWLGIPLVLYITGLHTEVAGCLQQMLLATGFIKPAVERTGIKQIPADYNLDLLTLDGKKVSLQELKGKVIFMNLWATWCPPCVAEMPVIHSLYQKYSPDKVAFVMLSLDETKGKIEKFIRKKDYSFPVYTLAGQLPQVYATQSIPTTFVISKDGQIVVRQEGMAQYDSPEFEAFLNKLIVK